MTDNNPIIDTNNNPKGNAMPFTKCYAVTLKGDPCKVTGGVHSYPMLVNASRAITANEINPNNMSAGWMSFDVPLCPKHGESKREIKIQSLRVLKQEQLPEMPLVPTKVVTPAPPKGIYCGKCKQGGHTLQQVRDCYGVTTVVSTPAPTFHAPIKINDDGTGTYPKAKKHEAFLVAKKNKYNVFPQKDGSYKVTRPKGA